VAALAERLWAASGGHPFMIVETMAALDDQASLPSEAAYLNECATSSSPGSGG